MIHINQYDNVYLTIESVDSVGNKDICKLVERFSIYDDNYINNYAFKSGKWDGKINFIRYLRNNFYITTIGLWSEIESYCNYCNIEFELVKPIKVIDLQIQDKWDDWCKQLHLPDYINIRWYQKQYVEQAIKNNRQIVSSPTGSGKSLIIGLYIRFLWDFELDDNEKILLIVPTTDLVDQMKDDLEEYGLINDKEVNTIYHGQKKYFPNLTISTWQSLYKEEDSFFKQFAVLIIDEVHRGVSASINSIGHACVNARFRLGTTGSIQDEITSRYKIQAYMGPICKLVTTIQLIEEGSLTPFVVKNIILKWKMKQKIHKLPYQEECKLVAENSDRFQFILNFISSLTYESTGTCLILGNNVEYLKKIYESCKDLFINKDIFFITGKHVKKKNRKNIIYECKANGGLFIANWQILGTGVNIPNIDRILLVSPNKSKISLLQLIGRGVRLAPGKTKMELYDIIDTFKYHDGSKAITNSISKHLLKKEDIYDNECYTVQNYEIDLKIKL